MILQNGQRINGFKVQAFIKDGLYNETYKIADEKGFSYFMKLYDPKRMPSFVYTNQGDIQEIVVCKQFQQENLPSYIDSGSIIVNGIDYKYLITNYFTGELVADRINRGALYSFEETRGVMLDILNGLSFMHTNSILHNDITPRNIMFDETNGTRSAKLIDIGHAANPVDGSEVPFSTEDLTPFYRAQETFYNKFSIQSDLFSLAAVAFTMLSGKAPWETQIPDECLNEKDLRTFIYNSRKTSLNLIDNIPDWFSRILTRSLDAKASNRYDSALSMIQAIVAEGKEESEKTYTYRTTQQERRERNTEQPSRQTSVRGNGFADVAGMDELKSELQHKVIFLLKNPEKAQKYKLTPPNGMILYGPPGCGKSYFAEKFAEETGFNFKLIKTSDIGSTYIHGTQGKISELFNEARNNAPFVICFDEFDAMAPKRSGTIAGEHQAGEVNEFLSQLNNCSKDGIFVIATTNKIDLIDEAVLRKGRLDMHVEIPYPDERTRRLMFDLYLKDRPCSTDIDTAYLAAITNDYVAAEIAYIVNDAAMQAAYADDPIKQETLVTCIKNTPPQKVGISKKRTPIGFQS